MYYSFVIWGLLSEAWSRATMSFERALQTYQQRKRLGIQPTTSLIDFFDVNQQYSCLIMGNLLYILVTSFLYMHMKKKSYGYRLRWVLVIYDAMNVMITGYICYSILLYKLKNGMLLCNSIVNDLEGHGIAKIFALFFIQKNFEFFDTWWFILRKSFRQVTFLHLFHHASITVVVGSILPFDYNGDMYLPILLNSANHMLIYFHYLLASLGIRSPWGSSITSLQLAQFVIIFCQSLFTYRIGPTCGSPDFAKLLLMFYMGNMILLFVNFYLQKYLFGIPSTVLDFCGVIKRPHLVINTTGQYYGRTVLDNKGESLILLPESFPDAKRMKSQALLYHPFHVIYLITPIGTSMPKLYVSKEVFRLDEKTNLSVESTDSNRNRHTLPMKSTSHDTLNRCSSDFQSSTFMPMFMSQLATKSTSISTRDDDIILEEKQPSVNIVKSASFSDFEAIHNDRLIDGPLPSFSLSKAKGFVVQRLQSLRPSSSNHRSTTSSFKTNTSKDDKVEITSNQFLSSRNDDSSNNNCNSHSRLSNPGSFSKSRLCFKVSGGSSNGVISWSVSTVPITNIGDTVGGNSNSSSGYNDIFNGSTTSQTRDDWRAIS